MVVMIGAVLPNTSVDDSIHFGIISQRVLGATLKSIFRQEMSISLVKNDS